MGPQKKTTKLNYIKPKTPEFLMKYKTKAFETFVERKSYIEKKNFLKISQRKLSLKWLKH